MSQRKYPTSHLQTSTNCTPMAKLDDLKRFVASNSGSSNLMLDRMGITVDQLEMLIPFIASKCSKLSALSLKNNRNPLTNIVDCAGVLADMDGLRSLSVTIDEEEAVAVPLLIPQLNVLNGNNVRTPGHRKTPQNQNPNRQSSQPLQGRPGRGNTTSDIDLSQISELYNSVKLLYSNGKLLSPSDDRRMTIAFDKHVDAVTSRLKDRRNKLSESYERRTEGLMAKHGMYDIRFQEVLGYSETVDQRLGEVLKKIRGIHTGLFQLVPEIVKDTVEATEVRGGERVDELVEELEEMRLELERSEDETGQLLEAAEMLESEAKVNQSEMMKLRKQLKKITAENENMRAELSSTGAVKRAVVIGGQNYRGTIRQDDDNNNSMLALPPPPIRDEKKEESGGGNLQNTQLVEAEQTIRNLTLKQLLAFIEELYASKEKYDKKCAASKLPRETMEQHMYTFLNQRYGLRSLIVDNASAVIKAVNSFHLQENTVAVFGKILRNEIDEEFRFVQKQLKDTVMDLLRVHLKAKHVRKPDDFIHSLAENIEGGVIAVEEWTDIIQYMYNEDDATALGVMLADAARKYNGLRIKELKEAAKRQPRAKSGIDQDLNSKMPYADFVKVLLDFQLLGHDRFLTKFRDRFYEVDKDNNGIINEEEFRMLCSVIGKLTGKGKNAKVVRSEADMQTLLHTADPHNNNHITFSEAVACLSGDIVEMVVDMHSRQQRLKEINIKREQKGMKKMAQGIA
ncbi:hypothetical protein TL16_g12900 [Triparma laevis f. inornata]|uniref:EF-hand domain-containing protein n=1 Tax=Triparma laevis f. inornata TaxID=1714386 RepID=A0A9W7EYG3_9STRA|nr:hypothetical protein TL16_g12900 [Triparma laevis f. inornata]